MTYSLFEEFWQKIIPVEGEYSDNRDDSGGKTRWGVTESVARRFGYLGDMRALPLSMAKQIYKERYWGINNLDRVADLTPSIALELADTGVNMGPARAAEFLQRSLNALNKQGKQYPDVRVDGDIGPATINCLKMFLHIRGGEGELVLLKCLNALQGAHYIRLVESRQKDEEFFYGWIKNRV